MTGYAFANVEHMALSSCPVETESGTLIDTQIFAVGLLLSWTIILHLLYTLRLQ